jgi:hypothetical protein
VIERRPDMDPASERWPGAGQALWDELERHPGRMALVCGAEAERTADLIASALGVPAVQVGRELTRDPAPPRPEAAGAVLQDATVLVDCEVLFDPELGVDPLQLLRTLARRAPRIAIWPGRIEGGRAVYSEPGRRDFFDRPIADAIVLRPRATTFPDEVPYTLERIP